MQKEDASVRRQMAALPVGLDVLVDHRDDPSVELGDILRREVQREPGVRGDRGRSGLREFLLERVDRHQLFRVERYGFSRAPLSPDRTSAASRNPAATSCRTW